MIGDALNALPALPPHRLRLSRNARSAGWRATTAWHQTRRDPRKGRRWRPESDLIGDAFEAQSALSLEGATSCEPCRGV